MFLVCLHSWLHGGHGHSDAVLVRAEAGRRLVEHCRLRMVRFLSARIGGQASERVYIAVTAGDFLMAGVGQQSLGAQAGGRSKLCMLP